MPPAGFEERALEHVAAVGLATQGLRPAVSGSASFVTRPQDEGRTPVQNNALD
jgi:transketolase C-terminal domain/subunit